jgi:TonB family protein
MAAGGQAGAAARPRILLAAALSVAAHAAMLAWLAQGKLESPRVGDGRDTRGAVVGRLIVQEAGGAALIEAPQPQAPPPGQPESPSATAAAPVAAPSPMAAAPMVAASSQAAPAGSALDRFTPAPQLSSRPVALSTGELEPDWVMQIREPAAVAVSVYVEADGSVSHVEVRNASNARVGDMVKKAFEEARFKPGTSRGASVAARVDISVNYEGLRDRITDPLADRPAENVLRPDQVRQTPALPPDKPQGKGITAK